MTTQEQEIALKDLADIKMGQSPPSEFYNEEGEGTPFFQGVTEFGRLYPAIKKYTTKVTKLAATGDILMSVRAPVGDLNIAPIPCCIGRGLCAITPKENNRFVFYLLKANKNMMSRFSNGAIYESINKDTLNDLKFSVPSKSERAKIAAILTNYDYLIENNAKRIQLLESMAKLIYDEWFVKFKFPGHEKIKMVDSGTELEEIPEGWEVRKLNTLIAFKKGKQAKNIINNNAEGAVPYLLIDGIKSGSHIYTDEKGVFVERNDIIMVMDGASSGVVFIGHEGNVGSTLAKLEIKDKSISPYFIMIFLQSNFDQISANNTGAAIPHASKEFIYDMSIAVPKEESRKELFSIFEKLFRLKSNIELKNINLSKTRNLLLPRLMSGEIDVSELDIKIMESEL